jgi:hypothetical protein
MFFLNIVLNHSIELRDSDEANDMQLESESEEGDEDLADLMALGGHPEKQSRAEKKKKLREKKKTLNASSPDEEALVTGVETFGYSVVQA